ncbi:MAG: LysR family transcriptional regulator [Ectothiorhodospiraceae bacterium]|nr:LysR family transcriptional regulator [Ectothiorhodospiraceae bacterium]
MGIELRHLAAFVAVAESLHFRRAAERLHVAQPALSRTIAQLEARLGARLVERSTRNVRLTEAGRVLLPEARATLAAADRAVHRTRAVSEGTVGHLSVTYMDFAINGPLPAILARFRATHPDVEITLRHLWTERQREAVLAGEVDIGFLIGPFDAPGVRSVVVRRERLCVVLPAAHRLAAAERVPLGHLRDEPFVLGNLEAWAPFRRLVDDACRAVGFTPRVVQEAYNSDGIFGLVAAGLGVTVYVDGGARRYRPADVVVRPLADVGVEVATTAAWRADNRSPVLARFVEALSAD